MPDSEEVDAGASPAVVGSSTGKEPIASPSAVRRFPDGGTEAGPSDRSSSPSALQMGWLEVTTATERLREIDAARGNTPLKRPVSGAGGAFFVEEPVDSDSARHRDRGWSARGSAGAEPSSSFSGDRNIPRSPDARDESPRTGTALWRIAQKKLRTVAAFQKSLVPRGAGDPRSGDDGAAGARAGPSDVTANMDAQMDAWLRQTVERMPVKPDHISGVRGPLMNVSKVDDKTVDVTMTTSFRAHFSQPISKLGATVATGAKGEGVFPELEGPPSPGTDRRARVARSETSRSTVSPRAKTSRTNPCAFSPRRARWWPSVAVSAAAVRFPARTDASRSCPRTITSVGATVRAGPRELGRPRLVPPRRIATAPRR